MSEKKLLIVYAGRMLDGDMAYYSEDTFRDYPGALYEARDRLNESGTFTGWISDNKTVIFRATEAWVLDPATAPRHFFVPDNWWNTAPAQFPEAP